MTLWLRPYGYDPTVMTLLLSDLVFAIGGA